MQVTPNTIEKNSVIRMRCCSCRQQGHADSKTLLQQNPPVLSCGSWLRQVVLYNDCGTVVVVTFSWLSWVCQCSQLRGKSRLQNTSGTTLNSALWLCLFSYSFVEPWNCLWTIAVTRGCEGVQTYWQQTSGRHHRTFGWHAPGIWATHRLRTQG